MWSGEHLVATIVIIATVMEIIATVIAVADVVVVDVVVEVDHQEHQDKMDNQGKDKQHCTVIGVSQSHVLVLMCVAPTSNITTHILPVVSF